MASVFFLDVGQGSANLIHLGENRFAVIDFGPGGQRVLETTLKLLTQNQPKAVIETIVFTHAHEDHWCGFRRILETAKHRPSNANHIPKIEIRRIYLVDERTRDEQSRLRSDNSAGRRLIDAASEAEKVFNCSVMTVALADAATPVRILLGTKGDLEYTLALIHPTAQKAKLARETGALNDGSGVLTFKANQVKDSVKRVVFCGDAPIGAFSVLHEGLGRNRWPVGVLVVSHHGGNTWRQARRGKRRVRNQEQIRKQLDWLYRDVLETEYAFISVGTNNAYDHPCQEVIQSLIENNARVLCSQITARCLATPTRDIDLYELRPHTLSHDTPLSSQLSSCGTLQYLPATSQKSRVPQAGRPSHVGCASTVVALIDPVQKFELHRFGEHQLALNRLDGTGLTKRMCQS